MKRWYTGMLAAALVCTGLPAAGAAGEFPVQRAYEGQFADVPDGAWYAADVALCYERGLMSGKSGTRFDPDGTVTYAEAAALAARVHEIYNGGDGLFPAGAYWWSGAAEYLAENRILSGRLSGSAYSVYFDSLPDKLEEHYMRASGGSMGETYYTDMGPWADQPLDRLCAAAWLCCALPDEALEEINTVGALPDEPEEETPEWAAIKRLYRAGVLAGDDAWGTFAGYRTITRAEFAAVLSRAVQLDKRLHFTLRTQTYTEIPVENAEITSSFHEGLVAARNDDFRYGYLDTSGQWAIPPVYTQAEDFINGAALVRDERDSADGYRLIDAEGKAVLELSQFDQVIRLQSGNLCVQCEKDGENLWGLLDADGKELIPVTMRDIRRMGQQTGVLAVQNESGKYAVFAQDGTQQTDFRYASCAQMGAGSSWFYRLTGSDGEPSLCYDAYGRQISEYLAEHLEKALPQGYLYRIPEEGTGFMDLEENVVIPPAVGVTSSMDGYLLLSGEDYYSPEGEKLTFAEAKEYILQHAFADAGDTEYVILPTSQSPHQSAVFDRQGNQVSPVFYFTFTFLDDGWKPNIENGFAATRNSILKLK